MFRIKNKIEPTDSDNRNRSPVFVVLHDYYFIVVFGRFRLNDAGGFYGVTFLIKSRLPNIAVGTKRDGVFSRS
ncbi:MAG TPA: hypothetical protein VMQ17_26155 [Candidatus Sulfotelmatobacter sp.]|jgi:hypothetical protein|nr:hypothetical protein [Candidatus Sulfotelmatobacter sp.]